ncbi:WD40-repeat-containing domain protein, partial [Paraphysoderma sedebokerense]
LNALSASPDKDQVVVAGREVLKILSVTDTEVKEVLNLRIGSRLNLNFSSNDVKWCNHYAKFTIATAATNGAIVIWDLQKPGQKLERVINEHTRAVNRVTFHPTEPILLLSASQDGTLKLWDLRAKNFARHTFEGKAESVRDVQFSPTFAYEFAAAFENGTIQRWDIRNPSLYERKLNAHNGLALTVDYHPDGRLVASGGRDKMIKIWDMKSDTRKPIYYIQTIASVARISWRPSFSNSTSTFPSSTSPLLTDHRIHVYDLSRPCIPQYSLDVHDNVTTGFLWDDSETLWSVGKDKYFVKSYIRGATRPVGEVSKSAVGWNGYGDLTIAVDEGGSVGYRFGSDDEDLTSDASADKGDSENETYYRTQHELSSASKTKGSGATTLRLIKTCESNSQVAWNCGHYRTAESWKLLAMFYSSAPSAANPPHDPSLNSSNRKSLQRPEQNNSYIYDSDFPPSINVNSPSSTSTSFLSNSLSSRQPQLSSQSGVVADPGVETPLVLRDWDPKEMVEEMLMHYANQGDVQMCVTVLLVLRNNLKSFKLSASLEKLEEQWFSSYIDLLHRFKLWSTAAAVMSSCTIASVRAYNQESTTIYTTCNNCFKPLMNSKGSYWYCEKCTKLLNTCSLCHRPVKGLYVWCQSCSHGGHLSCLQTWFQGCSSCPTGC